MQLRAAGFEVAAVLADIAGLQLRAFRLTKSRPAALSFADLAALPYQAGVLLTR